MTDKPVNIEIFFDQGTHTLTYVVWDPKTRDGLVIDPVLNYEEAGSHYSFESLDHVTGFLQEQAIHLYYILETHAHADHLTAAYFLQQRYPQAKIAIGEYIREVQQTFKPIFYLPANFPTDGSQFDHLLKDKEIFTAGSITIKVIHIPGHTPACVAYHIEDALFSGDALLSPDSGTGRCDFPGGDARTLYKSITHKLYTLPDYTRLFIGHDYPHTGRRICAQYTIGQQKQENIRLKADTLEEEFVHFRHSRDKELAAPRLLLPSIQVNIAAGKLPPYLILPLKQKLTHFSARHSEHHLAK